MLRSLLLCSFVLLLGCGGESSSGDPAKVTYAASLGVDLAAMEHRESGLYVQDLQVGTGDEATAGRRVTVHYTGWLPDGTQVDTSRSAGGKPIFFTPGEGRLIDGWEEGIIGMKVGGLRRLVIPSKLGYGSQGSPPVIPPNAVLVFDLELVSIP